MDRSRGAADRRRAGGDTVQQNIPPTVASDAPVLYQLARHLVPLLAAAGQRIVLADPPSASGAYAVMTASAREQRLNFFAGAYGST